MLLTQMRWWFRCDVRVVSTCGAKQPNYNTAKIDTKVRMGNGAVWYWLRYNWRIQMRSG
jgi:hypothetical protein